ncbi:MEKHLA domain-containing protein [Roseofilum capinflatum]|uniref:MEKHLA domain-containing protein n=1 Tax=Roseofilum capinflatum BLCC-M114 TaxID=3022440 RepID=A0ABT7B205_9CYAN|nr:MEKHLA domain-containing protein [Roseofilum capinflatum]MDJ1173170.1 MEKHLA domain-containing protein [Roseofilum capinflatum BLCC-M114]
MDFPWQEPTVIDQTQLILNSYQHWFGFPLLNMEQAPIELAQQLFEAPFVIFSHSNQADPIYNYGNRQGLRLWELSWEDLRQTPSRTTTEPMGQEDRNQVLTDTSTKGYAKGYSGVRISSTGKRILIKDVMLWNLLDQHQQYQGQAAMFSEYHFL